MKKILVLLFVLFSFSSFSQTPIKFTSYKCVIGNYNKFKNDWVYNKPIYGEINFFVYNDFVSVNDEPHSIYKIISEIPINNEPAVKYIAQCTDEKNLKCTFTIIQFDDGKTMIVIIYPKTVFTYHIN